MPQQSRTSMVLASRGDPIFGALGRLALRGIKTVARTVRSRIQGRAGEAIARIPGAGRVGAIVRSRPARVLAEGVGFGVAAAGAGQIIRGRFPSRGQVSGEFVFGPGGEGCPTGKVVEVAAHQRIIPLDRFGRPRRRIDVLNTKALARATRRLGGFQKRARRVEKQLARIAPRSRSRRRSKGAC